MWLTWHIARSRGLTPKQWVEDLPLLTMLDWLADALKRSYKQNRSIALALPLPPLKARIVC